MQESFVFDIDKIHILIHKVEVGGFYYSCASRLWDGFVVVTGGECEFEGEKGWHERLKKGDIVFLRQGEKYKTYSKGGCSYFTSAFDFSPESDPSLALLPKTATLDALHLKMVEKFTETWQKKSNESFMFCKIQLLKMYFDIIQENTANKLYSNDGSVNLAIKYIHNNFKRGFKSSEIAAYCSLSESHLRLKFSNETGMSIVEYRDALRLKAAKELLASGMFSVKETAYELGFCDVYYFSKFFTKRTSITPAKYIGKR